MGHRHTSEVTSAYTACHRQNTSSPVTRTRSHTGHMHTTGVSSAHRGRVPPAEQTASQARAASPKAPTHLRSHLHAQFAPPTPSKRRRARSLLSPRPTAWLSRVRAPLPPPHPHSVTPTAHTRGPPCPSHSHWPPHRDRGHPPPRRATRFRRSRPPPSSAKRPKALPPSCQRSAQDFTSQRALRAVCLEPAGHEVNGLLGNGV